MSRIDPVLMVVLGIVAVTIGLAVALMARSSLAKRARDVASLTAIDFVRNSFVGRLAHGEPLDELLPDAVSALRGTMRLDAAEIWVATERGDLRLAASDPGRSAEGILLTGDLAAIVATAPVSGRPWLAVWLPELLPERDGTATRFVPITASGELLGAIVVERTGNDQRLAAEADPTLIELATELASALRKQRLDSALHESLDMLRRQAEDLRASRARIVAAGDAERRRIERDLHDGAQQYLVAIAVKAGVIRRLGDDDRARSTLLLDELVRDTQRALDELRNLSHGIYPPLLTSGGLCDAVSAACRRAVMPTEFEAAGIGRYAPEVEAAVYFCCLEALQNAAKHAGSGATAKVAIREEAGELQFEVRDDGAGFDVSSRGFGAGLTNMGDRVGAVGGTLRIESGPETGTGVCGAIPIVGDRAAASASTT